MANNLFPDVSKSAPIIAWWSGGVTSAITCWLCIKWFGKNRVVVVMIDTFNEDPDTYRFKRDCERWYGCKINSIWNKKYSNIKQVWLAYLSLNVANGAICSSELKRAVRMAYQKENPFSYQAFGFDTKEVGRAQNMKMNYPDSKPMFPLLIELISKSQCIKILQENGISPPIAYAIGLNNNNCLQTGCVQGGIGYWQYMLQIKPDVFDRMADTEHELTELKGQPVTMLKDQGKDGGLVFLRPHPLYPDIKDISMMKGRPPKPLMECNGFCGVSENGANETHAELNLKD